MQVFMMSMMPPVLSPIQPAFNTGSTKAAMYWKCATALPAFKIWASTIHMVALPSCNMDSLQINGSGSAKGFYFLRGSANAPVLDSATEIDSLGGLNTYPTSGTVYRFTPKPNVPIGVTNVLPETDCQVYPTEASNQLFIHNQTAAVLNYTVCALTGQKLLSGTVVSGVQPVSIDALAAGIYLVQVQNTTRVPTFRIQKK
ncbi:MAG: T9SS type A sorting domain-containing protein [Sphingobacteriales bacterium]|nr:MAG: T9SS type A sorting domain-containing protein [Sphingobacteriales bacterium]